MGIVCPDVWAIQDAVVSAEKAVIYSDLEMSSPLGFVLRGKKIKVGEIARNKGQLYPIIVSGKMAFIRLQDINTDKDSMDANILAFDRFQKQTRGMEIKTSFAGSYFVFNSTVTVDKANGMEDKDPISWSGFSLKGSGVVRGSWEFQVLSNYMTATKGQESYKVIELGFGGGWRIFQWDKLKLRLEGHALFVPLASYSYGSMFTTNGSGLSVGGGPNLSLMLGKNWGIEAYGQLHYVKIGGLDAPRPYVSPRPIFTGLRAGVGVNYSF
jgi:hypothetical protein